MTDAHIQGMFEQRREAWNRHEADRLAADYAEDAVLVSPYVGQIVGRAAIGKVYRSFFSAFTDLVYQDESLVVENEQVAQFFSIAGTQTGEFLSMSATGRRFECHLASLFTMRGEEICFERRVYDFSGLLIQIGVLKTRPV